MKKDSTKKDKKENETEFRFKVGDEVVVKESLFDPDGNFSRMKGKVYTVKATLAMHDGARMYFISEGGGDALYWEMNEVCLEPYSDKQGGKNGTKEAGATETDSSSGKEHGGIINASPLVKYLREVELSDEDYQILTDTWIGIERMKEILGGRVDAGTMLGHAVGSVHCIQTCIMEMLTSPKNTGYLNHSFGKIRNSKKERKSEYRRKCPHCGKEFEYDSGNVVDEERGLYGSFRFVKCKKCGHDLPHYESMIGNEIERILEKEQEKIS